MMRYNFIIETFFDNLRLRLKYEEKSRHLKKWLYESILIKIDSVVFIKNGFHE
jgi:hypothetical protein